MDAKSDQIFAEFSAKMGVASVREYEETRLKRQTEVAETRAAYKTQVGAWLGPGQRTRHRWVHGGNAGGMVIASNVITSLTNAITERRGWS